MGARPPDRSVDFPIGEIRPIAEQILTELSRTVNLPPEPAPDAPASER